MHLLLAGIFEKQGAWGDGSSPQSVVFQLQHAIQVQERSGAADVSSPGLHQRLGRAYAKVRKPGLAWNQFVIAADEFAKDENCEAVIELEEEARGLGEELGEVPAELRGRWDRVLAKCRS